MTTTCTCPETPRCEQELCENCRCALILDREASQIELVRIQPIPGTIFDRDDVGQIFDTRGGKRHYLGSFIDISEDGDPLFYATADGAVAGTAAGQATLKFKSEQEIRELFAATTESGKIRELYNV